MAIEDKLNIIKNLPADKQLVFYQKLQQRLSEKKDSNKKLRKYPRSERNPLSAIQEQIWFYEQIVKGSNAYNVPIAMRLTGTINFEVLGKVLNELIHRHEVLRSYFKVVNGKPYQFALDELNYKPEYEDIREIACEDKFEYAKTIASNLSRQHLDLDQCPIFKVKLIRMGENDNVLVFVVHHILCDNWSLRLIIRELISLYNSCLNGEPIHRPEIGIQYIDYCYWEQETLKDAECIKQIESLKNMLEGKIKELKLPVDKVLESWENRKAKSQRFSIEADRFEQIKTFCKENYVTTYIILFSAFTALLYRYTRENDITVGTSFLNRPSADSEYVIGPFINILLVCTSVNDEMSFKTLMQEVKDNMLNLHSYKHIPMYQVIKELKLQRNINALSLIQVFFDFLNFNLDEWNIQPPQGIESNLMIHYDILVNHNTPKFDMDFTLVETNQAIVGNLEYCCDIFHDDTISLMISHLNTILDALTANPDQKITDVPLFHSRSEERQKYEKMADFNF